MKLVEEFPHLLHLVTHAHFYKEVIYTKSAIVMLKNERRPRFYKFRFEC